MQLDVCADEASDQRQRVGDGLVEADQLRRDGLLSAEGQQLPSEPCGGCRGAFDLAEFPMAWIVRRKALGEKVRTAGDDGEKIVEIVRDAPRQACLLYTSDAADE